MAQKKKPSVVAIFPQEKCDALRGHAKSQDVVVLAWEDFCGGGEIPERKSEELHRICASARVFIFGPHYLGKKMMPHLRQRHIQAIQKWKIEQDNLAAARRKTKALEEARLQNYRMGASWFAVLREYVQADGVFSVILLAGPDVTCNDWSEGAKGSVLRLAGLGLEAISNLVDMSQAQTDRAACFARGIPGPDRYRSILVDKYLKENLTPQHIVSSELVPESLRDYLQRHDYQHFIALDGICDPDRSARLGVYERSQQAAAWYMLNAGGRTLVLPMSKDLSSADIVTLSQLDNSIAQLDGLLPIPPELFRKQRDVFGLAVDDDRNVIVLRAFGKEAPFSLRKGPGKLLKLLHDYEGHISEDDVREYLGKSDESVRKTEFRDLQDQLQDAGFSEEEVHMLIRRHTPKRGRHRNVICYDLHSGFFRKSRGPDRSKRK